MDRQEFVANDLTSINDLASVTRAVNKIAGIIDLSNICCYASNGETLRRVDLGSSLSQASQRCASRLTPGTRY